LEEGVTGNFPLEWVAAHEVAAGERPFPPNFCIEFQFPDALKAAYMTNFPSLSQLKQAVKLAEKIEELQKELDSLIGSQEAGAAENAEPKKKRGRPPMSAEAKEKIAAAQRKRWAKDKKEA